MKSISRLSISLCLIGLMALCPICFTGCGSDEKSDDQPENQTTKNQAPAVAVIDLNVVAQEIGAIEIIDEALREKEGELVEQLTTFESELTQKFKATKEALGMDLNDQDQKDLDKLLSDNQYKIGLQQQAAQSQFANLHAGLKAKFMAQVRPIALQIANEQGMNMVLTTNQIYAAGTKLDITQLVVERIKEMNENPSKTSSTEPSGNVRVAELPGGGDFMPQ